MQSERTVHSYLTDDDLNFIIRECGGLRYARDYCERISRVPGGPLSHVYMDAMRRLNVRLREEGD